VTVIVVGCATWCLCACSSVASSQFQIAAAQWPVATGVVAVCSQVRACLDQWCILGRDQLRSGLVLVGECCAVGIFLYPLLHVFP